MTLEIKPELNGDRHSMPAGTTLEDVWTVASAAKSLIVTMFQEFREFREEMARRDERLFVDIGRLQKNRSILPPPRPELPSILDPDKFAAAIKEAALLGQRAEGTTPDEQVEKAIKAYRNAEIVADYRNRGDSWRQVALVILAAFLGWLFARYGGGK